MRQEYNQDCSCFPHNSERSKLFVANVFNEQFMSVALDFLREGFIFLIWERCS